MSAIPRTQQYYPSVPLSELSDLYSKGINRLNNQRAFIISYLPKTLRLSSNLPFINKYALFIENTTDVDSIEWTYQLYLNGELAIGPGLLSETSPINETEYTILFQNDAISAPRQPIYDRLKITCTVKKGAETIELSVEHSFVTMLDATGLPSADVLSGRSVPFSGNPDTTNAILNHLKDYLQPGLMTWNDHIVQLDVASNDILLKIGTAVLYHNILASQNISPALIFIFDLNPFTNVGIKSLLNDNEPYAGNYVNGICRIPIHILSDTLTVVHQVPDPSTIDAGTGNAIYNILRDQGILTFNDLEGDVLRTVPQKIQDSKQRILNDIPRFVEFYNLTLFPKSAIKLTAILIQYLLECSQKNNCNECKDKNAQWQFITLEGLKDHPDFLKNILTHYFREPSNKIETFSKEAAKTTSFVWSPAVYTILNVAPRIIKAYFAKKVVKQINAVDLVFHFEKIDSTAIRLDRNGVRLAIQPTIDSMLGRQIYLVIETLHSRNREITVNVQPIDNTLTGDKNPLVFASGRDFTNFVSDISKTIGNYDDLKNRNNDDFNDLTKEYLNIDHRDKAIIKLRIRPDTVVSFTRWVNNLQANITSLRIVVRYSNNAPAFFGNDITTNKVSAEFLSANDLYQIAEFRLANRNVYEIYREHGNNSWNFLPNVPVPDAVIGKVINSFVQSIADGSPDINSRRTCYYFYDRLDNEHFFGEFDLLRPAWINTRNYPNSPYNDDLSSLVNANDFVPYEINLDGALVSLSFLINTADRRYVDMGCFAALLGAMARSKITRLGFNGFSNNLGQSVGGSVSHVNGIRGDLRYLRVNLDGAACLLTDAQFDLARQIDFNNSLHAYGLARLENMLSESLRVVPPLLPHTVHFHRIIIGGVAHDSQDVVPNQDHPQLILAGPLAGTRQNVGTVVRHNNHLHVQGFSFQTITDIIQ